MSENLKDKNNGRGILYGVSVGPGDPELMTLKACRVIRESQVIALPNESLKDCVAYQIAVQAVPEIREKEILCLPMPMTKDQKVLEQCHREAANRIREKLEEGKNVAFLTLGDATIYSTCLYVYEKVKAAGEKTEIVSGVPSFCAAAARLDTALVSGAEELHILPATYQIEKGMELDGVKVLMKAGKKVAKVKALLTEEGRNVQGVKCCGLPGEKIYRSAEEIDEDAGYYSLFIVS